MNIRTVNDFINADPIDKRYYLKIKGIELKDLCRMHKRKMPAISRALSNHKPLKSLLTRIANNKKLELEEK